MEVIEIRSQRSKKTRNRVSPLQLALNTASTPAEPQQVPTVFGRSSRPTHGNNIVAARKLRKKTGPVCGQSQYDTQCSE